MTDRERQLLTWIEEKPLISQQELAQRAGITRSSVAVHISNLMKKGLIQGKGYILQTRPYAVVIGGASTDIFGCPAKPLIARDSNPGTVSLSPGGVGRNIAHNLSLLGEQVKMITAFGEDVHAEQITRNCRELGIDISCSLTVPNAATSTYLFITNHFGDMELAISDMEIYNHLTPEFLSGKMDLINRSRICIADTNPPQETLEYLAENCKCPLFVDTVSTTKAVKLRGILDKIHTIKPNRMEAQLLTGITITDDASLEKAALHFLKLGVKQVFISLGSEGVFCADKDTCIKLPCYPAQIMNTTGAGDSFLAALAWAHLEGFSLADAARAGLAASSICVASKETISPQISTDNILAVINKNGSEIYI
ncbi:PfkB family carbohydrate kinase [Hydrogenoanaerobacterium sp.]|uniref:PfkB family carbohydrate kinase n=1 Tax=Hydrogenoanaerobacterium sp. TaxID=2953763 RepID=UPI00289D8819|nr:PfkB family carbohydrate kinase [Hydrogenoanaerobacterium sp.]